MCIGNLAVQKKSECLFDYHTKNEIKVYLKLIKMHIVYIQQQCCLYSCQADDPSDFKVFVDER
jgi:hypothetical protein